MHCGIVCVLFSSVALAQLAPREPLDAVIQAYWKARKDARYDDAIARREEARRLLESMPADAPQFGNRVQNLTQLYEGVGMSAQARAIAQAVLARAEGLGASHPTRILLLNSLADSWQQDRNLLKALVYREKAVAALDSAVTPPEPSPPRGTNSGRVPDNGYVYDRLADLYQQLGRPEAAAAVLTKMRTVLKNNDAALASWYERQGQLDEAAALYKKQAEQAALNPQSQPWQISSPLQALANLYQREEHYDKAAAALQQAIASLDASGKPEAHNQALAIRLSLAGIYNQAGQTQAADQVYQQLLAETPDSLRLHIFTTYANHLSMTKRAAQAEKLLNDYLAAHSSLQPWEESHLLLFLSQAARQSGQGERADEYQRAGMEKQQAASAAPPGQMSIARDLQRAQSAAQSGNLDETFTLTLQAMDAAPRAVDRDQIVWQAPSIAYTLLNKKAPDKADQLYENVLRLVQSWSADTLQPLLNVLQNYPRFLMARQRWDEVPTAIERYRDALIAARGAGTGWIEDILRLTIDFERSHGSLGKAVSATQDLLTLEESLSGTTSEPYLRATETLAGLYEWSGDGQRALPLRRQAVAIADLVFPASDARRGSTRMSAAFTLARELQFEEAERLASEAVAIGQRIRPPQPNLFTAQLAQIQQMKARPQTRSGAGSAKWFQGPFETTGTVRPWRETRTMVVTPDGVPAAAPPPPPKPASEKR